ncbi:hypothetical protein ACFVR2_17740 [Gottfriedia sp. NPDC057991]|uniref:hypothetical protein n=1 Tax=Gottfriedia sp. NPDC057991 TaxID=3346298 RepID=UPI0036D9863A
MNNVQILYVNKKKIIPVFHEHFEEATKGRLRKLKPYFDAYDLLVPVEKDPEADLYYATGAIHKLNYLYNDNENVLCLVEEFTSTDKQLLKYCRRLSILYRTSPQSKKKLISKLSNHPTINKQKLINQSLITRKMLKDFQYSESVPLSIQNENELINNPLSQIKLNMIYDLSISIEEKNHIFKLAKERRIIQSEILAIKRMLLEIPEYHQLSLDSKFKAITFITYSSAMVLSFWESYIRDILNNELNEDDT